MTTTTDFQCWLDDGNEPDDFEEAYALHLAASGESAGSYSVTETRDGKRFIKGPGELTLALVSDRAIKAFENCVERFKGDDEMGWEGWYGFERAMAKDD
jgi:hypothetical protein